MIEYIHKNLPYSCFHILSHAGDMNLDLRRDPFSSEALVNGLTLINNATLRF